MSLSVCGTCRKVELDMTWKYGSLERRGGQRSVGGIGFLSGESNLPMSISLVAN